MVPRYWSAVTCLLLHYHRDGGVILTEPVKRRLCYQLQDDHNRFQPLIQVLASTCVVYFQVTIIEIIVHYGARVIAQTHFIVFI
jgi:hypothetical protein